VSTTPHDVEDLNLAGAGQLRTDRAELTPRRQDYLASWTQGS
jgi:hypothetical protein